MNIEKRQHEFQKMKKVVQRKFKGCELKLMPGGYTIQQNGKNVVNSEWPDLQFADSVYDAYKNAYICEHWDRQKLKGDNILSNTINNVVGNSSDMPRMEAYEYHEASNEIDDDSNINFIEE